MKNKEIAAMSDLDFAAQILQQRLDKIYNPNSPLATKLRCAIHHLRAIDVKEQTRPAGYWFVQYYDAAGEHLSAMKLMTAELDRIGNLVRTGFTSGEITEDAIR